VGSAVSKELRTFEGEGRRTFGNVKVAPNGERFCRKVRLPTGLSRRLQCVGGGCPTQKSTPKKKKKRKKKKKKKKRKTKHKKKKKNKKKTPNKKRKKKEKEKKTRRAKLNKCKRGIRISSVTLYQRERFSCLNNLGTNLE